MAPRVRKIRRLKPEEEVSVVDHLDELRQRLIVSLLTLGAAFAIAFWQHGEIIEILNRQLPPAVSNPTTLDVTEPLRIAVTVSLWSALIIALPVIFYQLYAFVVPAFSEDTQSRTWPVLLFVPALFLVGVSFAYFIVVPISIEFLQSFDDELYNNQIRAGSYYPFVVQLMVGMGIIFELPAATMALARVGLVTAQFMRQNRKYAIFVMAVAAAALPGGDPLGMILALFPLLILYEISIWLCRLVERRAEAVSAEAVGDL